MSDEIADREHPAAEKLSAYLANELSPEENDAIQEHVTNCSLCAERLLDLQRFLDFGPEGQEGVVDFETAAERARLRQEITRERTGSPAWTLPGKGRAHRILASATTVYGLAAVLTVGLIGLSLYTAWLRRELRGPEMNSRAVFLLSRTLSRSSEDQVETIELASREKARITFSLEAPRSPSFAKFRLEVRDPQGRLILMNDELKRQGDLFVFTLPAEGLRSGRYSIEVRGLREGDLPPVTVGRYEFRIRRP